MFQVLNNLVLVYNTGNFIRIKDEFYFGFGFLWVDLEKRFLGD